MVVLVGVAGIGARAWLGADTYPKAWHEQTIDRMALSHDRGTLYVYGGPEVNLSCQDARAEVDTDDAERWVVTLETRQTKEFCLVGVCIEGSPPPPGPARTLDPGETLTCSTVTIGLDRPVPADVEVVAA